MLECQREALELGEGALKSVLGFAELSPRGGEERTGALCGRERPRPSEPRAALRELPGELSRFLELAERDE